MLLIGSLSCSIYEFRFRYVQQNLTGKLYHNSQRNALNMLTAE
jgi:hypothetical protein